MLTCWWWYSKCWWVDCCTPLANFVNANFPWCLFFNTSSRLCKFELSISFSSAERRARLSSWHTHAHGRCIAARWIVVSSVKLVCWYAREYIIFEFKMQFWWRIFEILYFYSTTNKFASQKIRISTNNTLTERIIFKIIIYKLIFLKSSGAATVMQSGGAEICFHFFSIYVTAIFQ